MKRKATPAQLKALAKGRAKRRKIIKEKARGKKAARPKKTRRRRKKTSAQNQRYIRVSINNPLFKKYN